MSLINDIDDAVSKLRESLVPDFSNPEYDCNTENIQLKISNAITNTQKVYNIIQMALKLLEEYPDEDSELLEKLKVDLMGNYALAKPFYSVRKDWTGGRGYYWIFNQQKPPIGGLKIISQLLLDSLSFECKSTELSSRLYSAYRSFIMIQGPFQLLKSRLEWTVMHPDSFSKDSIKIKNVLVKHGMENVWHLFQTGMDNYRQGFLSETANGFSNALTAIMKAISRKYGYSGGQLGQHTMYLDKIGYIHQNIREMISRFYSYLAKFRKGEKATQDEARLLVDLSFTLFGFLAPKMSTFKLDSDVAKKAKKDVKDYVKQQKEDEARKIVAKADKKDTKKST